MKKIFAILLCIMLTFVTPLVAYANTDLPEVQDTLDEGLPEIPEETEETPSEVVPEEMPEDIPEETPDEPPSTETPEEPPVEEPPTDEKSWAEKIEEWIVARLDDIAVVVTLLLTIFYNIRKHRSINKVIAKFNNNSIALAENSNSFISTALSGIESASNSVTTYTDKMALLLEEIRKNAEEKKSLEDALQEVAQYLKTAKLANVEFADELAELLVLANIPNSMKDDIFNRHRAAVAALAEAEKTEVKEDVGTEE